MRAATIVVVLVAAPAAPAPAIPTGGRPDLAPVDEVTQLYGDLGLTPEDDGTWVYVDPAGHFTARFEVDGTVEFADRWKRPSHFDRDNGKCCALPPPAPSIAGGMAVSGPVEWVARIAGEDLNARAKAELLSKTAELRTRLAVAHTKALLDDALERLVAELRALWADESLSPAERRALVFALWDDCDELVPAADDTIPAAALSEIDALRLDVAWRGRRTIEAWIRKRLPADGPDAYTAAELERLNAARVSVEPFEPYVVKPNDRPQPPPADPPPTEPQQSPP